MQIFKNFCAFVIVCFCICSVRAAAPDPELMIHIENVGAANCIVFSRTVGAQKYNLIYDMGYDLFPSNFKNVCDIYGKEHYPDTTIIDRLIRLFNAANNYVVLSHLDKDHIKIFRQIGSRIPNLQIVVIGSTNLPIEFKDMSLTVINSSCKILCPQARINQQFTNLTGSLGDNVSVNLLPTQNDFAPKDNNECSVIMKVEYANKTILACGDATMRQLYSVISNVGDSIRSPDLIIAPHHLSITGGQEKLYQIIDPKCCIGSTRPHNQYHFPRQYVCMPELLGVGIPAYSKKHSISFWAKMNEEIPTIAKRIKGPFCIHENIYSPMFTTFDTNSGEYTVTIYPDSQMHLDDDNAKLYVSYLTSQEIPSTEEQQKAFLSSSHNSHTEKLMLCSSLPPDALVQLREQLIPFLHSLECNKIHKEAVKAIMIKLSLFEEINTQPEVWKILAELSSKFDTVIPLPDPCLIEMYNQYISLIFNNDELLQKKAFWTVISSLNTCLSKSSNQIQDAIDVIKQSPPITAIGEVITLGEIIGSLCKINIEVLSSLVDYWLSIVASNDIISQNANQFIRIMCSISNNIHTIGYTNCTELIQKMVHILNKISILYVAAFLEGISESIKINEIEFLMSMPPNVLKLAPSLIATMIDLNPELHKSLINSQNVIGIIYLLKNDAVIRELYPSKIDSIKNFDNAYILALRLAAMENKDGIDIEPIISQCVDISVPIRDIADLLENSATLIPSSNMQSLCEHLISQLDNDENSVMSCLCTIVSHTHNQALQAPLMAYLYSWSDTTISNITPENIWTLLKVVTILATNRAFSEAVGYNIMDKFIPIIVSIDISLEEKIVILIGIKDMLTKHGASSEQIQAIESIISKYLPPQRVLEQ